MLVVLESNSLPVLTGYCLLFCSFLCEKLTTSFCQILVGKGTKIAALTLHAQLFSLSLSLSAHRDSDNDNNNN